MSTQSEALRVPVVCNECGARGFRWVHPDCPLIKPCESCGVTNLTLYVTSEEAAVLRKDFTPA